MKSRPESRPAVRWLQRLSAVPLGVLLFAEACGSDSGPPDDLVRTEERSAELVQTCTATNVSGNPYAEIFVGEPSSTIALQGSFIPAPVGAAVPPGIALCPRAA